MYLQRNYEQNKIYFVQSFDVTQEYGKIWTKFYSFDLQIQIHDYNKTKMWFDENTEHINFFEQLDLAIQFKELGACY